MQSEEAVVLHRRLPQVLARPVRVEVEPQQGVVALGQLLPQLDEELLALEADLDDLGPAEHVDPRLALEHR